MAKGHLGIIHYFQHYHKSTQSTLGGGGKSSCAPLKMLVLATVPVATRTSLAHQNFYSNYAFGKEGGVCERSILCTFVKMLKIMDSFLASYMATEGNLSYC